MKRDIEILGYNITSDPDFMNEQNAMTPELKMQMEKLYTIALKGKESGIKKLHRVIEKHPRNPQLKNFLSVLYVNRGNTEKSREVNNWIIAEHPNYLFGKINLALEYYSNDEVGKMPEILGEGFNLKTLYPERDTFHIVEIMAMLKAAVFYYGGIGDLDQAELRLDMMEELDPESNDFEQANRQLITEQMNRNMSLLFKKRENIISVNVDRPAISNTTQEPTFIHSEIELLYNHDITISTEDIETILSLPRESLIKDLELILSDSIERYTYFQNATDEFYDDEKMSFVVHSFYFLAELKAQESLNKILEVLSQGEEYIDLFLGDFITDNIWEVLFKLRTDDLSLLKEFMLKPGIYTYTKTEVSHTLAQVVLHYPDRKNEVVKWFDDVFNYYLNCTIEDNVIDSEMIGLLVASIIDFKGFELLPTIKKLDDKGYIFEGICGTFEDIEFAFTDKDDVHNRKEDILTIKDRYKQITNTWAGYQDEPINVPDSYYQSGMDAYLDQNDGQQQPLINIKGVGRNAPCPCESGKKYKKCCLNK